MGDLQFITYETPDEAKKSSNVRTVKSQAARHHWARDRATRGRRHGRTQTRSDLVVRNRILPSTNPPDRTTNPPDQNEPIQLPLSLVGLLGEGRVDPFRTYPVAWQSYFPELVDHYVMNIAVRVPRIDPPRGEAQLRTRWFPLAMTDPATFSSVLLLAASHMYSVKANPAVSIKVLTLKEQAIKFINEALADPSRSYSDAIIGAVLKMCCYEAIFDNADSYVVHMRGLQGMVAARGGLSALGVNGLLRRICLWIDMRSALTNQTPRFFEEAIPNAAAVSGSQ